MHLCIFSQNQTIAASSAGVWETREIHSQLLCQNSSWRTKFSWASNKTPVSNYAHLAWPHSYTGCLCGCSVWQWTHNLRFKGFFYDSTLSKNKHINSLRSPDLNLKPDLVDPEDGWEKYKLLKALKPFKAEYATCARAAASSKQLASNQWTFL